MKILILANKFDTYTMKRFQDYPLPQGVHIEVLNPFECKKEEIEDQGYDVIINRISGISYSDNDLIVQEEISKNALQINMPKAIRIFRDKARQNSLYEENNIARPETLDLERANHQLVKEFINRHKKVLFKPKRSNQAKGITAPTSPQDALKLYCDLRDRNDLRYVLQEHKAKANEWRIYIIDQQIYAALIKRSTQAYSVLNCETAQLELASIKNEKLKSLIKKVVKISGLYYMALDIGEDDNGDFFIIETNCIPGSRYIDQYLDRPFIHQLISKLLDQFSMT